MGRDCDLNYRASAQPSALSMVNTQATAPSSSPSLSKRESGLDF